MALKKKPSMGRQKIDIKRLTDEASRQVTFSKRRSGLFKKASELCTLCGAEVAILVFSPAGKAFSFGHPCVESLIDRYLTQAPNPAGTGGVDIVGAHRRAVVCELNQQLTDVNNLLEAERKRGEAQNKAKKRSQTGKWWESPVEELGLHELEQLMVSMEELRKNVAKRADQLLMIQESAAAASSSSFFGLNPITGGGMADPFVNKTVRSNAPVNIPPQAYPFPTNAAAETNPSVLPPDCKLRYGFGFY